MMELKISQDQFNQLCCAGKLHFVNHDLWLITWLTFFEKIAVSVDGRNGEKEIIKLIIE